MANNSQDVREVQEKLRAISFGDQTLPLIAVDGVYGPMTSLSVSAFQQREGLPVTGKVDLTTWRALNDSYEQTLADRRQPERVAALNCNIRLREGTTGSSVFILQTMLNQIGGRYYNIGTNTPNGVFDDRTSARIREYQRAAGVPVTGVVDKATWDTVAAMYNKFYEQVCI